MTRPAQAARAEDTRVQIETTPDDPGQVEQPVPQLALAGLSQPAVVVGSADDPQEHAADAVADRVVAALRRRAQPFNAQPINGQSSNGQSINAGPMDVRPDGQLRGSSIAALRRQAERTAEHDSASTSSPAGRAGGALSAGLADRLDQARTGGSPLNRDTRAAFESAIGADLGGVRLHAGPQASMLNRQVGARAFTVGQDIFFANGLPDVASESGQHLLAHELAHTVQPGGAVRREVVAQLTLDQNIEDDAPLVIRTVSIVGRPPPTFGGSMGDHSTAFTVHVNAIRLMLEGHPLNEAVARMQDLVSGLTRLPGTALIDALPARQAGMFGKAYTRLVELHAALTAKKPPNQAAAVQEYICAYLDLRELVPLSTINAGEVSKATAGKGKGEDTASLRALSAGGQPAADLLAAEIISLLDVRAVALACAETDPIVLRRLAPGVPSTLTAAARGRLYIEQHLRSIQTAFPGALAAVAADRKLLATEPKSGSAPDSGSPPGLGEVSMLEAESAPKPESMPPPESMPQQSEPALMLTDDSGPPPEPEFGPAPEPVAEPKPVSKRDAARAEDDAAIPLIASHLLHRLVLPLASSHLLDELQVQHDALGQTRSQLETLKPKPKRTGKGSRTQPNPDNNDKKTQLAFKQQLGREAQLLKRVNAIEVLLGRTLTPAWVASDPVLPSVEEPEGDGSRRSSRKRSKKVIEDASAADERQRELVVASAIEKEKRRLDEPAKNRKRRRDQPAPYLDDELPEVEVELDEDEVLEGEAFEDADPDAPGPEAARAYDERREPQAIQVLVGEAGTITGVLAAGRPPSPFAGATMGAHTTAWVVHVDRVRRLIIGKTIAEAQRLVAEDLAGERTAAADQLAGVIEFPEKSKAIRARPDHPDLDPLTSLQHAIIDHLEAVNSMPGATLPAADINGKGEGRHRRVLQERLGLDGYDVQAHSPEKVLHAIARLFDVGSIDQVADKHKKYDELTIHRDQDPAYALATLHLRAIEASYPGALAAAGLADDEASRRKVLERSEELADKSAGGKGDDDAYDEDLGSESEDEDERSRAKKRARRGSRPRPVDRGEPDRDRGLIKNFGMSGRPLGSLGPPPEPLVGSFGVPSGELAMPIDDEFELADENPGPSEMLGVESSGSARLDDEADELMLAEASGELSSGRQAREKSKQEPFQWDPAVFGPSASSWLSDEDFSYSGGLFSHHASSIEADGEIARTLGSDIVDDDGDLLAGKVPEFADAYRADVAQPGVYLTEAEGNGVAGEYGITVHVYRDTFPAAFARIENVAGGDCLIHACADIRAAKDREDDVDDGATRPEIFEQLLPRERRAETAGEISRVRAVVSVGLAAEEVNVAVGAIVRSEVDGIGTAGLGPHLWALLSNPQLQFRAGRIRNRRQRAKAKANFEARKLAAEQRRKAKRGAEGGLAEIDIDVESSSAPVSIHLPPKPKAELEPKAESEPKAKAEAVPDGPEPEPVPQLIYGDGAVELNYALLHTGGNHYVALIRTR